MHKIKLWENFELADKGPQEVTLKPYTLSDGDNFAAMLILPGGGYEKCSNQEGAPVAGWLNSLGIAAFVLEYRVAPAKYPSPYHDARRAIQYIRHHAEKFNIDPNRVGVIGFSAGGHLAATLSNHYEMKNELLDDDIEQIDARPDISVLSYPVISWGDFRHQGSLDCLLGENPDAALQQMLSMEHAVHQNTPKTFLWHTAEDALVPVENTYLYAMALSRHKIEHEVHVYPHGEHGIGLGTIDYRRNAHATQWRNACEKWLFSQGF